MNNRLATSRSAFLTDARPTPGQGIGRAYRHQHAVDAKLETENYKQQRLGAPVY